MITISIATERRRLAEAETNWVTEQVLGRRRTGADPCVVVSIEIESIHLSLRTGSCTAPAGPARAATPRERELIERWREYGLEQVDYPIGRLVAFLNHLRTR